MLSRLITAETGNYDRASLKIPSLTVSLGKQLELISPADLIYNHTFSWRQETLTLLHLSEDENLVHFVSLSFNFTPVDITYPSLTTKLWIHLYFHTVLVLSTKRKKKETLIIVHEKFLLEIRDIPRSVESHWILEFARACWKGKTILYRPPRLDPLRDRALERLFKVWKETRFD